MEHLLTPKALAAVLGLAEQTIYNRHSNGGDLPICIKLGRLLRFRPADVEAWLAKQLTVPEEPAAQESVSMPRRRGRPTKAEQVAARRAQQLRAGE
ncbi:helix-turn-helix domain-containing protein [Burkholderia multivorans]|uniref:helix-turn-helix transcriptional regulator n=1 Tax=Burkholderia multivorans TaxID=87883 RepID=UPI002018DE13|nr:helix-turn-helix domain-containing protein [Burkholderia multivorans]MCO1372486.1 helix-turn-helix domain-containing protein [Burkholderia multivorans]MCO1456269.1 helix-turn-helix domain-containing protein [Burkholderia multivorans]MCO1465251.1 helix-turn-helix domain-containing protein [Burkholderia multivorans]UQO17007.1 helix-turn-helix domain-containing protein [Burkholderia multivorans]UQO85614.1 helix-turn-helix domain-containing protein [Burkholderia multivorans]